jgi:hypothetical protein
MLKNISLPVFGLLGLLTLSACSGGGDGGGYACPTVRDYSNGVTVTGTAVYEYRDDGNQAINAAPNPIRQAEVQVYDGAGALIQCARTKDTGVFSFKVPSGSATISVRVNSKIYNDTSQISVFNDPVNRALHYISKSFVPSASMDLGTLTATAATSTALKGGAFNILDKVYSANLYLISTTANCDDTIPECTPVTSIPAISIFWDKGVDPGEYVGTTDLSYYLDGRSELYLLGGIDGDVDSSDTDHFDNSIIVHEYGHFIVDVFSKTDSPRGTHNGRSIIDPRLAFGEGWPDFFQAAVLNTPLYLDTSGTIAGTASELVRRDIETPDQDVPATLGEGNFREFSIARYLWDVLDTPNDGGAETTIATFAEIWTLMTSATAGLNADYHFRNIGLLSKLQSSLGVSDWSSARTNEFQKASQIDYVRSVGSGSCSATAIAAQDISVSQTEDGTAANSNMFASNDFYQINHTGGAFKLVLSYTPTTEGDLDLYLYNEDYVYGDSTTYAATPSTTRKTAGTDNTNGTETINTSLPAGLYVINVRVFTGLLLGSATYTMTFNGAALCPK